MQGLRGEERVRGAEEEGKGRGCRDRVEGKRLTGWKYRGEEKASVKKHGSMGKG